MMAKTGVLALAGLALCQGFQHVPLQRSLRSSTPALRSSAAENFDPVETAKAVVEMAIDAVTGALGDGSGGLALLIQNKGGGHGELGYHLAKILSEEQNMKVTIFQEGTEEDVGQKEPFKDYAGMHNVEVRYLDLTNLLEVDKACSGREFDVVYDNWSKSVEAGRHYADIAKSWKVKNYVFVSSAGMYTPGDEFPVTEKEPSKKTGQRELEEYADAKGLPWSSFRPQYIYGPKANKRDYLDFFFDRITRDRPLPIPGSGQQVTTLTDARDVAAMLAAVTTAGPAAHRQVFNCASGRVYTIDGIAQLAAKAAGKDPASLQLKHYDPKALSEAPPKSAFPFRAEHFGVSAGKARRILNWESSVTLEQGLQEWYEQYTAKGFDKKEINFEVDDKILKELA